MKKTKTKKQNVIIRFFKRAWAILKAIYNARDKIFYAVVGLAEVLACIVLALVEGETRSKVAIAIALPLGMDFFNRAFTIFKTFAKAE